MVKARERRACGCVSRGSASLGGPGVCRGGRGGLTAARGSGDRREGSLDWTLAGVGDGEGGGRTPQPTLLAESLAIVAAASLWP